MEILTTKQKIFKSPVTKMILALLVFMTVVIIGQQIASKLLALTPLDKDYRNLLKGLFVSTSCVLSYILFFKKYEKRAVTEFASIRNCKKYYHWNFGWLYPAIVNYFSNLPKRKL